MEEDSLAVMLFKDTEKARVRHSRGTDCLVS